jgi:hypothetical protein
MIFCVGLLAWRKCGSSVACRNPMLTEVAIMLEAAKATPGIRTTPNMLAVIQTMHCKIVRNLPLTVFNY